MQPCFCLYRRSLQSSCLCQWSSCIPAVMLHRQPRRHLTSNNEFLSRLLSGRNSRRQFSPPSRQIQMMMIAALTVIFGSCLLAVNYQGSQIQQRIEFEQNRRDLQVSLSPVRLHPNLEKIESQPGEHAVPKAHVQVSATSSSLVIHQIAVVLACYNRPDYFKKTLDALVSIWPLNGTIGSANFSLIISQDGSHTAVTNVIEKYMGSFPRTKHITFNYDSMAWQSKYSAAFMPNLAVYYKISAHYHFILSSVMKEHSDYTHIVFIEDDMLFSPDFLHYFAAVAGYLEKYASVFCASAWNDNGQALLVDDPGALFRTDVFPGLGWMMKRDVALEFVSKWPAGFWDDWLRDPEQRKGRSCVSPEVSRTKTFGSEGSSQGEFFDQFLAPIKLNSDFVDWSHENDVLTSVFDESGYEKSLWDVVNKSEPISTEQLAIMLLSETAGNNLSFRIDYSTESEFQKVAQQLGCMPDWKAGIPRASYQGVSQFRIRKSRLFVVKRTSS